MNDDIVKLSWPVPAPRETWTPWQVECMRRAASASVRDRRWGERIPQWIELQRITRKWMSFAEIADRCARKSDSVERDETWRAQAYRDLAQSIFDRKFSDPKLYVVDLSKNDGRVRLNFLDFRRLVHAKGISSASVQSVLANCWLPTRLAIRWFAQQGMGARIADLARIGPATEVEQPLAPTSDLEPSAPAAARVNPISYDEVMRFLIGHDRAPEGKLRKAIEDSFPGRRLRRKTLRGAIETKWGLPGQTGRPPKSPSKSPQS
ncbi:MAG: hypothetical protein WAV02_22765 [Stellaceae bacterium]